MVAADLKDTTHNSKYKNLKILLCGLKSSGAPWKIVFYLIFLIRWKEKELNGWKGKRNKHFPSIVNLRIILLVLWNYQIVISVGNLVFGKLSRKFCIW